MTVLVATTLAPWKLDGTELHWLKTAEEMRADYPEVEFFAALETDARGLEGCESLLDRLDALDGAFWTFHLHDGQTTITTANRLRRICMGRNAITEYALSRPDISHVLFLDSDLIPQGDCISKLLELDMAMAGGDVPSYCLQGPEIQPNVQQHWNTAGFLMVTRYVLRDMRWGHDPDAGETDDPWFQHRAVRLGYPMTLVRKDVKGLHRPLIPVEQRSGDPSIRW